MPPAVWRWSVHHRGNRKESDQIVNWLGWRTKSTYQESCGL
jgi:hypothetical protein